MGALVTGLVTFFSWLADKAATLAVFLGQAALLMARLLWTFALQVGQVFAKVWGYFGQFWRNVLKPFVTWSWKEIQRLHGWLEREFRPLVSFLNDVRKHILDFYSKWLRPVFDTIEITRRLLQILASFHVAFAAELDRRLAAMEEILLRPITLALSKVNEAIDIIDRIVDFDGVFQRLTLVASALKYERDMWKVWWTSVHKREIESKRIYGPLTTGPTIAESAGEMRLFMTGVDSLDRSRIAEHAQDMRLWLRRVGGIAP